jgi:pre-mRNA-processing factor 17
VKIWDAHNQRACKRSYSGHTAGIRDANFTHDGRHFLTASFDRFMRYWDTETGQCISTLTNRKVQKCTNDLCQEQAMPGVFPVCLI